MPEVDKDEILGAHHISQEPTIEVSDISALPPLSTTNIPSEFYPSSTVEHIEGTQNVIESLKTLRRATEPLTRPPTAPPVPISRSDLRTFSEPPPPPTNRNMINENQLRFQLPPMRMERLHEYNDTSVLKEDYSSITTDMHMRFEDYPSEPQCDVGRNTPTEMRSPTPFGLNVMSWHPHVYAKPPKAPTPHSIGDILGIQPPMNPKPARVAFRDPDVSRSTINQILNANSKPVDGAFDLQQNYSHHLHDRLVGTQHNHNSVGRSTSLSEGSEDDSAISDQPLNLSITKSRDASPQSVPVGRPIKQKKGQ